MTDKRMTLDLTNQLYDRLNDAVELQEKRTGIKISVSDFIRIAISEKILRGK